MSTSPKYPLRIEVRPLLTCGVFGFGPDSIFILLAEGMTRQEAATTLWHEIIHVVKSAHTLDGHDEAEIERIAEKLSAACPEILELCGVSQHFKS